MLPLLVHGVFVTPWLNKYQLYHKALYSSTSEVSLSSIMSVSVLGIEIILGLKGLCGKHRVQEKAWKGLIRITGFMHLYGKT